MTPDELLALSTRVARTLAKGRYQEVEDLAQDGVIAMLQAPPFSGRGDETRYFGWRAYCGMVNGIRQRSPWSRSRRMKVAVLLPFDDRIVEPTSPATQDVEVELRERAAWVARAVAALPADEREAVRRYYYRGELMREVGAALGLCESRISQLLAQARDRLRVTLEEEP